MRMSHAASGGLVTVLRMVARLQSITRLFDPLKPRAVGKVCAVQGKQLRAQGRLHAGHGLVAAIASYRRAGGGSDAAVIGHGHQQAPVHQVNHGIRCPYGRGLKV